MNDLIAAIYETLFGIYNQSFDLIFSTLFNDGGYFKLFLIWLGLPLVTWFLFYLIWMFPYGKKWHWWLWLFITLTLVFGITWGTANAEIFASNNPDLIQALSDSSTGYEDYAGGLPLKYAITNTFMAFFVSFIYSIIFKHFSKIQTHLPF